MGVVIAGIGGSVRWTFEGVLKACCDRDLEKVGGRAGERTSL